MDKGKYPAFKLQTPAGASELFSIRDYFIFHTSRSVTCQICGTAHPPLEVAGEGFHTIFTLFGYDGVLECCGKLADDLYHEWGTTFTERTFAEFRESPLNPKFQIFRQLLKLALSDWLAAAKKAYNEAKAAAATIPVGD